MENALRQKALLGLTMFLSGACMMCIEIAGGLTIAPFFGSTVFVWGAVITVFMAGLSSGYALGGRIADRAASSIVLAAILFSAGVLAAVAPFAGKFVCELFAPFRSASTALAPSLAAIVLFFAPSMLLGMTAPLCVRLASTSLDRLGRTVGRLYAFNALGSVAGALAGAFIFSAYFGNRAIIAGSGFVLIALSVAALALKVERPSPAPKRNVAAQTDAPHGLRPLIFICGAVMMSLEIVGGSQIAPYFGSSVFVWGGVIAVFLGAMTVGYRLGGRIADRRPDLRLLALIAGTAGTMMLFIPIITPAVCDAIRMTAFGLPHFKPLAAAAILYFPPTMLFAMAAPFAVRVATAQSESAGGVAGRLYALSTLGNMTGALLTTFILLALIGKTHLLEILGLSAVAAGAWAAFVHARKSSLPQPRASFALLITAFALAGLPKPQLVPIYERDEECVGKQGEWSVIRYRAAHEFVVLRKLAAQRESPYHHIAVIDEKTAPVGSHITLDSGEKIAVGMTSERGNRRLLKFDQYVESSVVLDGDAAAIRKPYRSGTTYSDMLHLPIIWKQDARAALIVGGGGGVVPISFRECYDIEIDVVEIDPLVVEIAREWFAFEPDARTRVFVEDGRLFVHNSPRRYDLVILDAYTSGGRVPFHLTTREFLQSVRARLTDDGVVLMNVINALEGRRSKFFRSELKTFFHVFGEERVYVFPKILSEDFEPEDSTNIMIVATGPAHKRRLTPAQAAELARKISARNSNAPQKLPFHAANMLTEREMHAVPLDDVPVLTDDFAPVDLMVAGE